MTVQTSTTVATGIGNGVTTTFPIGFKFNRNEDLIVNVVDEEAQTETLLTLDSDYTVAGAGNQDGGSITLTAGPLAEGKSIVTKRMVSVLQMTDLRNQGKFFAEVHEDSFDKGVMIDQQQQEQLSRTMVYDLLNRWNALGRRIINLVDPAADTDAANKSYTDQLAAANLAKSIRASENINALPAANSRAGKLLSFDDSGNPKAVAAEAQSATDLELRLQNATNPSLGATIAGRAAVTVESLAELAGLPQDKKLIAQLQLGCRSGVFQWDGSDLSSSVSNDSYSAIYVPPTGGDGSLGAWVRRLDGAPKVAWWKQGASWVAAEVQAAIDYVSANSLGELDCRGENIIGLTFPLFARDNVTILLSGGEINNSSEVAQEYSTFYLGQCNREDIARIKGVVESAHSLGTLAQGASVVTIGLRWNNATEAFSNAANYTPLVGDLVVVCTTDNTTADPTRPVPSYTMHRRIVAVSGMIVTLDKGVIGTGDYMLSPMSRDLGYDRSVYGGVGRMYAIQNPNIIGGKVTSDHGYAYLTGACIGGLIACETRGKAGIYGNGVRETAFRQIAEFSRTAIELALGTEDADIQKFSASHFEAGDSYTVACLQLGELSRGVKLGDIDIDAPAWNGSTGMLLTGLESVIGSIKMKTACTGKIASIGSSAWPFSMRDGGKIEASSSAALTGLLLEVNENSVLKLNYMGVSGQTSNADSAIIRGTGGRIGDLVVLGDAGPVRVTGSYVIGTSSTVGTLVFSGTRVLPTKIKGNVSEYLPAISYAAAYTPVSNFRMSLTGPLELQSPSGIFDAGDTLLMVLEQDGTGGRTVTFAGGSLYRGMGTVGSGTASQRRTLRFQWTGSVWVCIGGNGAWLT